jgi:hypothetical protein
MTIPPWAQSELGAPTVKRLEAADAVIMAAEKLCVEMDLSAVVMHRPVERLGTKAQVELYRAVQAMKESAK